MLNSREIEAKLKESIFGQDELIRVLSITGYKHEMNQIMIANKKDPINNNILICGPTGCGKTYATKILARLIDVPVYEIDCTQLTENGYAGKTKVEKMLDLVANRLRAGVTHSIIVLDEFDKIYDSYLDIKFNTKGIQEDFLKVLEPNETFVEIEEHGNRNKVFFNTGGITFIACGSFEKFKNGMRESSNMMGFGLRSNGVKKDIKLTQEDLINGGFIPELVGRFSRIININPLSEKELTRILLEGKDSVVARYKEMFKFQGITFEVDKSVMPYLAYRAGNIKTGARALNNVLSEVLDKCIYDVSSRDDIQTITLYVENNIIKTGYTVKSSRYQDRKRK